MKSPLTYRERGGGPGDLFICGEIVSSDFAGFPVGKAGRKKQVCSIFWIVFQFQVVVFFEIFFDWYERGLKLITGNFVMENNRVPLLSSLRFHRSEVCFSGLSHLFPKIESYQKNYQISPRYPTLPIVVLL